MANAQTVKFSLFKILLGNGAAPEVFAQPCGARTRGFKRSAAMAETNVPDCADEDAPPWLERDVVSLSAGMTFAGVVDDADFDTWDTWFASGATKNVQIVLKDRTWQGPAKISDLEISGERGQRTTFSATITSDGEFARV